ncbi:MAG TPA: 2,3-bisphosphoglycerate-independent phosphoglycerate mutase [Candidatus Saccharimonadales bacterium]|nr:2,3-bisphosphoglycerate-independent phosphoglycerate mutase [Candidatus Saccharimonadales bacterium]
MAHAAVPLAGLIILDGWGLNPRPDGNAVAEARTPIMDALMKECPHATLVTWGESVGLPPGQMGNSEVGHLNLGAGRVVYQDLTRIDRAIEVGDLARNPVLRDALQRTKKNGAALHFIGLHSTGGVHSHLRHLHALLRLAASAGIERILVHAITDGRDVAPRSARPDLESTEAVFKEIKRGRFATVSGRYFTMDRDKRWDRTEKGWRAMVLGEGETAPSAVEALERAYARGENDEFVLPTVVARPGEDATIARGDTILAFNFRPDRMRQISRALADPDFDAFERPRWPLEPDYVCMTSYDETFPYPVLFSDEPLRGTLGEVVSRAGLKQVRMAETEKYAHVTYFFNGSEEVPFPGEDRVMVPSAKVATYDLKPEMSANELTEEAVRRLSGDAYDFFVLNYANADMVGHTGKMDAAVRAVETVDGCLGRLLEAVRQRSGTVLVTADHGNADQMIDYATGGPHTAHTMHPVPLVLVGPGRQGIQSGILADVAPTLLRIMGLTPSPEMTGRSLLTPQAAGAIAPRD